MRQGREAQRVRVRLARQRPGRARTQERGRERASRPWWRDLGKLTAAVTIFVSVVGLSLTGVGTVMGALVSADQLNQSKEVAQQQSRAQATRVSSWVDTTPNGDRLHLMNRSADPIGNVLLVFASFSDRPQNTPGYFQVALPSVPPCSDLVIEGHSLRYHTHPSEYERNATYEAGAARDMPEFWKKFEAPQRLNGNVVIFADRDGTRWERTNGELSRWAGPWFNRPSFETVPGALADQPVVRPVKLCEDAG